MSCGKVSASPYVVSVSGAFSKDYLNETDTLLITINGLINPATLDQSSTFYIYTTDGANNKIEYSNMTTV